MSVLATHFSRGTARNCVPLSSAALIPVVSRSPRNATNSSSVAQVLGHGAEWRMARATRALHTSVTLHHSPAYPGHIPLNTFENAFLTLGSALVALIDPRRGGKSHHKRPSNFTIDHDVDMVAALGETTAGSTLPKLRDAMLDSPEGRRILKERPRINSKTLDIQKFKALPDGTFGREYARWLEVCNVTPDSREPVRLFVLFFICITSWCQQVHYIDDPELAYVMQRYRETHDFYHALFALRVSALPELALKSFEFANLGFPMNALALGASIKMKAAQRERLWREFVPWGIECGGSARCLLTVYWEERWEQDLRDIKKELGVWDPPAGASIRPS
jgi:ubiquinone biosynthesis protein COQ4